MYSKIALENLKKSFKDYTIYFLTLSLAVCIFYSFNSIESQKVFLDIKDSKKDYIPMVLEIISYVSIFVSFILGSLILYANNFLVKKRKKELGIYMLLGMGKGGISRILALETLIVGVVSVLSGLLLGVVASQVLSVFAYKMFDVSMSEYEFVLSVSSFIKVIFNFAIIFILVMLFNVVIVSKCKVIDLLMANKKNEQAKIKNPFFYISMCFLCVLTLGTSYVFVLDAGLDIMNPKFKMSIGLGIIGTILFFFSFSNFFLFVVKKNKNFYLKGLNIFVIKQLNSKVNTNFISLTVICLMLLFTIGGLSTGISLKNAMESDLKAITPFDASITMYGNPNTDVRKSLENTGFAFEKEDSYIYFNVYKSGVTLDEIFTRLDMSDESKRILSESKEQQVEVIKESEYNELRKLEGKKHIQLKDNETLVLTNIKKIVPIINEYLAETEKIKFEGKEFFVLNDKVIEDALITAARNSMFPTLVVKDDAINNLQLWTSNVNVNYPEKDRELAEERFISLQELYVSDVSVERHDDTVGYANVVRKEMVYESGKGTPTAILFVVVYLGIVFLITSMAVLALQQLSEATDSLGRYEVLRKIGANDKMINKTIFIQIFIYFSLPVVLAFIHSIVGIKVVNEFISTFNKPDIGTSSLIAALIFLVVYFGYFYATYSGYKNIIKNNDAR